MRAAQCHGHAIRLWLTCVRAGHAAWVCPGVGAAHERERAAIGCWEHRLHPVIRHQNGHQSEVGDRAHVDGQAKFGVAVCMREVDDACVYPVAAVKRPLHGLRGRQHRNCHICGKGQAQRAADARAAATRLRIEVVPFRAGRGQAGAAPRQIYARGIPRGEQFLAPYNRFIVIQTIHSAPLICIGVDAAVHKDRAGCGAGQPARHIPGPKLLHSCIARRIHGDHMRIPSPVLI